MRALLLLLCLAASNAWAACGATCWVDMTGAGTGSANGTSAANQCAGPADADCTPVSGTTSTVYYCGQRTSALTLTVGGTTGVPLTYNFKSGDAACSDASIVIASGSALTLNSTITNSGTRATTLYYPTLKSSSGAALFISGADDLLIDHLASVSNGTTTGTVTCSVTTLSTNIYFDSPTITDSAADGIRCLPTAASQVWSDWTINGGTFSTIVGHAIRLSVETTGWTTSYWQNVTITNNTFNRVGYATGVQASGAASFVGNSDRTAPVSSDTCASHNNRGGALTITGNTITDGGGAGLSGSNGINVTGFTPVTIANNSINAQWVSGGGISTIMTTYAKIYANTVKNISSANDIDGDGIYLDRYTANSYAYYNYVDTCANSVDTQSMGAGIAFYRATNNKATGNIVRNCRYGMWWGGNVLANNLWTGNTTIDCVSSASFPGAGVMETQGEAVSSPAAGVRVYNNSVVNCPRGITGADDITAYGYNNNYLVTTPHTGQTTGISTDTSANPQMVGGLSPTTAAGFHLLAVSTLRRTGKDLNIGNYQDCGNRAFLHPPSIGACEATSGDQAPARTMR